MLGFESFSSDQLRQFLVEKKEDFENGSQEFGIEELKEEIEEIENVLKSRGENV